jgi:hypothetical protein
MVVERGLARCPRCVRVADYVFIESETDGMRYEVHCHTCGERYGERSLQWTPPPRTSAPPLQWPPDCDPAPPTTDWRTELGRQLSASARRAKRHIETLESYVRMAINRARAQARTRRIEANEDQTGG